MDSLVSTDWLAQHLREPGLIVLDATKHLTASGREAHAEYLVAHIPGARFLDLGSFADPASPIGKTLPGPTQAADQLSSLGVKRSSRVVLYDDSAVKTSARAWFILRGYGVSSVAILDGGLGKWRMEGRPIEGGEVLGESSVFEASAFGGTVRRKADMLANIADRAEQVVDARDVERFSGASRDTVHNLPGGHIPGSTNLWFRDLYNTDGTFKPTDELRGVFEGSGIDLSRPIVTTCGSGITASVLLFALHRLGVADAALYDGSWSEWGADPETPKALGSA